jgi:hypothetical protein
MRFTEHGQPLQLTQVSVAHRHPCAEMASARLAKTRKSASLSAVALQSGRHHGADKRT